MKSLVQEAVSIAKAIDAAWIHAGKPENFSIKILEHPEKNFFGFNKKSAKIAFFFDEIKQPVAKQPASKQPYKQQQQVQRPSHAQQQTQQQQRAMQKNTQALKSAPIREEKQNIATQQAPQQKQVIEQPRAARQPEKVQPAQTPTQHVQSDEQKRILLWNKEHIETVRIWVSQMLTFMKRAQVPFAVEQEEFILKITFDEPLVGISPESAPEKKLFTHLSLLLMTILKKQYRSAFRGHRILFTHK